MLRNMKISSSRPVDVRITAADGTEITFELAVVRDVEADDRDEEAHVRLGGAVAYEEVLARQDLLEVV